jgi:uncharacterized caspase-like protein
MMQHAVALIRGVFAGLAVLTLGLVLSATADAAQRIALVVGNSEYRTVPRLKNPVNDARLVAARLRSIGFDVIEGIDLTREQFDEKLLQFSERATGLDTGAAEETIVLFYYAGHGIQVRDTNYLIPVDTKIESESQVRIRTTSLNTVLATLEETRASVKIAILDACRDNPFPATSRGQTRGLAPVDEKITGTVIAFAADKGAVALDGSGDNSPYSEALARMIVLPDLSILDMFTGVSKLVGQSTSGRQTPWLSSSLTEAVYLAGHSDKPPALVAKPVELPPESAQALTPQLLWLRANEKNTIEAYEQVYTRFPASEEAKKAVLVIKFLLDEKSWKEARDADTAGSYTIYMQKNPDGIYLGEAQRRLAALRNPGQAVALQGAGENSTRSPIAPSVLQDVRGIDAYGADYRSVKNVSYEECRAACESDPRCKAVTHNRRHSICLMKTGVQYLITTTEADAAVAAELLPYARRTKLRALLRTDIKGYDYFNQRNISYIDCLIRCEDDPQCRAFSYVRTQQWCFLKSDIGRQRPSRRIDSGMK